MARRILSLWLPRLASERALRRAGVEGVPLAIIERRGPAEQIACLSPAAEALGLRRGQPLAEARALAPGLITRPADPEGQAQMLAALNRWSLRYAPWGAVEGADGLVLDITGSAHRQRGIGFFCRRINQIESAGGQRFGPCAVNIET